MNTQQGTMNKYIRFSENYKINKLIPEIESPHKHIKNKNQPYFISMMKYSEEQYNKWKETKSLAGENGSTTNRIWADFDNKDLNIAFKDSQTFYKRLLALGVPEDSIQISFSGNKGLGFMVDIDKELTIEQVGSICHSLCDDLPSFDTSMYDHQRIFRLLLTKNEKTGLFKIPLTSDELQEANVEEIKANARSDHGYDLESLKEHYKPFKTNSKFMALAIEKPKPEIKKEISDWNEPVQFTKKPDMSSKPKHWKDYKWAIAQGHFGDDPGERHHALMILASTCRALGYDRDMAIAMCDVSIRKQAERSGRDPFPKEELIENIIDKSVYSTQWQGGQYSPVSDAWLERYCKKMGFEITRENTFIHVDSVFDKLKVYATDFEKNIVSTGIEQLDKNIMYITSSHNGILGQPGSGKTSFAIQWLENLAKSGSSGIFYSLDMGMPVVGAKIVQRYTGASFTEALEIVRNDPVQFSKIREATAQDYKNVSFNFNTGVTPAQIKDDIRRLEDTTGVKSRLLIVDYLECLQGPFSDATANTGYLSNMMKDVANEMEVCSVMLLQTQKHSTSEISDPLLSMKQVKGSSVIEQSATVISSLWREGYSPNTIDKDKYISFAAVKNRLGPLWKGDFGWEGKTGSIYELSSEARSDLRTFRDDKAALKKEQEKSDW